MMRAVFLDRDGVLNQDPGPVGYYVRGWYAFHFLPGVFEALRALKKAGFKLFVVSNQSGVARGTIKRGDLETLTHRMKEELDHHGASVDGVFYCMHDESDKCDCRKPKPGLFTRAAEGRNVDFQHSYNIGDTERDLIAGSHLGIPSILVLSGKTKSPEGLRITPDKVTRTLGEAVEWILNQP